jgi:hypothetical protein
MTLEERNKQILGRLENLSPLEGIVRQIMVDGKRDQLLEGRDAQGVPFAPLAQSTLKHRPGPRPPLAPRFAESAIVTGYQVTVQAARGELRITAGWPFLYWVKYHRTGTRRMPRRDPGGFRPADVMDATRRLRDYLFNV